MALVSWMLAAALTANAPAAPQEQSLEAGQREWRAFHAAIKHDGTPRALALASRLPWLDDGDPIPHAQAAGRSIRDAARRAPADELVQWLWASSPVQSSGCDADDPCPERAMALARITPDNAMAWAPVVEAALARHDQAGIDEALQRMSEAPYYEDMFAKSVDAWRDLLSRHPLPGSAMTLEGKPATTQAERDVSLSVAATALAAAQLVTTVGVYTYCDAKAVPAVPPANLARCQRIARLMLDSPTVMGRNFGNGILRRAGGTPDPGFGRQTQWWMSAMIAAQGDTAELSRYFADVHSTGSEIRTIEFALQRAGKPLRPPADWTFRFPTAEPAGH